MREKTYVLRWVVRKRGAWTLRDIVNGVPKWTRGYGMFFESFGVAEMLAGQLRGYVDTGYLPASAVPVGRI